MRSDFYAIAFGCIRNTFLAGSLWFLSALFVSEVVFKILRKCSIPAVIVFIALAAYFVSGKIVTGTPEVGLKHFFNWDWALFYLLYFVIGFYSYSAINKLFELDTNKKRLVFSALFIFSTVIAALVFEKKYFVSRNISIKYISNIVGIARTLILIAFNLFASRLLCGIKLFSELGRESLFLCGNEVVIKTLFDAFLAVFGLSVGLHNPVVTYIYTFIIIFLCARLLIPFEKKICRSISTDLLHSE